MDLKNAPPISLQALTPKDARQTAEMLHQSQESATPLAFSPPAAAWLDTPRWLDLSALNAIRHDQPGDFMVRVEAGATFGALDAALKPFNQAFPLSYPADATIGEVLAEDRPALESGFLGYPRDYVLKTTIATPDGQLTTSGADVVKNVTGYDLHKLYVGGRNAFGAIVSATLKVAARPDSLRWASMSIAGPTEAQTIYRALRAASLPLSACELFQDKSGNWRLLATLSGEAGWPSADWQTLGAAESEHLSDALRRWPSEALVIEAALPLARWATFLESVAKQSAWAGWRFQARPAAGLVYLISSPWPAGSDAVQALAALQKPLEALQQQAALTDGFLQVAHAPLAAVAPGTDAQAWLTFLETFNLPSDVSARRLLHLLKGSYDPKGVLFTPLCPLTPIIPSLVEWDTE